MTITYNQDAIVRHLAEFLEPLHIKVAYYKRPAAFGTDNVYLLKKGQLHQQIVIQDGWHPPEWEAVDYDNLRHQIMGAARQLEQEWKESDGY